ncbi:hypothetical protein FACS189445_6060 [Spirochaetia bacterium]|nr:hypothetical protein FACS189445_6060 [Spirochaetia bacterium]
MEKAMNSKGQIIYAECADYDEYYCVECSELSFLRKPSNAVPHFYHEEYNENCSLCTGTSNGWGNTENIWKQCIEILQKNYSDRWNWAIDNLIKYDLLSLLNGKAWALKRIHLYINSRKETITENLYNQFLGIIVSINTMESFKYFFEYIDLGKHRGFKTENIEKWGFEGMKLTNDINKYITTGLKPDIFTMFKFYLNMLETQKRLVLMDSTYTKIRDVFRIFFHRNPLDEYNKVLTDKNYWSNINRDEFEDMLLYYIEWYNKHYNKKKVNDVRCNDLYMQIKKQRENKNVPLIDTTDTHTGMINEKHEKLDKAPSLPVHDAIANIENKAASETLQTISITCINCGKSFDFTPGEQQYYRGKGYVNPKRCKECREKKTLKTQQSNAGERPLLRYNPLTDT